MRDAVDTVHTGQTMFDMLGNLASVGCNFEKWAENIGNAAIIQTVFAFASLMAAAEYTGSLLNHIVKHSPVDGVLKGLFQNPSIMSITSPEFLAVLGSIAGNNKGKGH